MINAAAEDITLTCSGCLSSLQVFGKECLPTEVLPMSDERLAPLALALGGRCRCRPSLLRFALGPLGTSAEIGSGDKRHCKTPTTRLEFDAMNEDPAGINQITSAKFMRESRREAQHSGTTQKRGEAILFASEALRM